MAQRGGAALSKAKSPLESHRLTTVDTAREAHRKVMLTKKSMQGCILHHLYWADPEQRCSSYIEHRLGISKNRFSGRLTELKALGYIEETGEVTRAYGNAAVLYRLTRKGYAWMRRNFSGRKRCNG